MDVAKLIVMLAIISATLCQPDKEESKITNYIEKQTKLLESIDAHSNAQNAKDKMNRNFERLVRLVDIVGQVDLFLTDRVKSVVKKLARE